MLKSKDIKDYFETTLEKLRAEEIIPFGIHLYFQKNTHVMLWRPEGERISAIFLKRYKDLGVSRIFIHNEDRAKFEEYLKPKKAVTPAPVVAAAPKTPEGKKIVQLIENTVIPENKKAALVAKEAREVLAQTAAAQDAQAQAKANEHAKNVIEDVLKKELEKKDSVLAQIWELATSDPEIEHGANVAMYATLLAMAFGRIDPTLITDLALSGLIHDIGLSQIPMEIAGKNWKSFTDSDKRVYATHVDLGLELLDAYAPVVSPRIRQILSQHHEKFDGSGYPRSLEGFKVDDISQLLAIADLLESMSSGRWDGQTRTLWDTFDTLEKLEKSRTFPEHFNPEIFSAVIRWIRSSDSKNAMDEAVKVAQQKREELVMGAKKAS